MICLILVAVEKQSEGKKRRQIRRNWGRSCKIRHRHAAEWISRYIGVNSNKREVNFLEFNHKSLERKDGFVYYKDTQEWGSVVCIGKPIPLQSYYRPRGFQEVETLRFRDNRHMKVVRASALHTSRPYAPSIPGTHFC